MYSTTLFKYMHTIGFEAWRSFNLGLRDYDIQFDVRIAFRLLPIHPSGFNLLGFHNIDICLPFGRAISCAKF